jgi:hypothetical protein
MQQIVISPFHWLLEPHCAHTTALSFNSSSSPLLLRRLPQQHGGSSPGSGASPAQTPPFSRQSSLAAGPGRRAALSSQESALWAIPFEQLELEEKIGEGAFGRVRPLVVVSYFFTSCWERGQGAQAQVGRGPLLNGRGGMAVPKGRRVACVPSLYAVPQVYRAEWHATPVAVKVLLAQAQLQDTGSLAEALAQPSPVLTRLQEEADLMFSLRHPNCVQLMGTCLAPPCLVTEYCSRGSLADCLRAARRSSKAAALLSWRRRLAMVCAAWGRGARDGKRARHDVAGGCLSVHGSGAAAAARMPVPWPRSPQPCTAPPPSLYRLVDDHCRPWTPPRACCTCTRTSRPSSTATSSPPTCWWTRTGMSR